MQAIAITVDTGSTDEDGMLILREGALVGVIVCVADAPDPNVVGRWNVEVHFGRPGVSVHPTFASVEEALEWFAEN